MMSVLLAVATAGLLGYAHALEVVTPKKDEIIMSSSTYTVEWTGTSGPGRYDIDLYYCGSYCMEDDCGDWVTALCPSAGEGCPDSQGDYDIVMPEPMSGTIGDVYKIRVSDVNDESQADCSDGFYIVADEHLPMVADATDAYLVVTSPMDGDMAIPGGIYTVEWDYNNGLGSSSDRFSIDLYMADGSGDCGTWVTTVCDKPTIGCKDTMGDYDVQIPEDTAPGAYKIRVGKFSDDTLYGCSGTFEIVGDGDMGAGDGFVGGADMDGSMSFLF